MGGRSQEHEVSIISGTEVVNHLSKKKYNIFPVVISKDGKHWQLTSRKSINSVNNPLHLKDTNHELMLSYKKVFASLSDIPKKIDLVFIAMHGPFGEDGTIQGLLDLAGIKYTGSGVLASALGMDKLMFRKIMQHEGIQIPKYVSLKRGESTKKVKETLGKLPYFVKPDNQGSSVGTSIVKTYKELNKALNIAWKFCDTALIDEYLTGTEITCAIVGNDDPGVLPLIEIQPKKGSYFDYDSKYLEGGSKEIVPARISTSLTKRIQKLAIRTHVAIGCKGFSRVDFILKENKTPYVLEINTIPGLTPMSLLPKAASASGMTYSKLLDKIIQFSLK